MRRVKYTHHGASTEQGEGTFHQFSTDYDDAGAFPAAIVERDDGPVITVFAEDIVFLDKQKKAVKVDCGTCKHREVSKYTEPCYSCNNYSNHEIKE